MELSISHGAGRRGTSTGYVPVQLGRRSSANRVIAGFGERGSTRMQFRTRHRRVSKNRCLRLVEAVGTLRGYLRFRGERRYVDADVHRLRAYVEKASVKGSCLRRVRSSRRSRAVLVSACADDGHGLLAAKVPPFGSEFIGFTAPRRGRGLVATSYAWTEGTLSDLVAAKGLTQATLTPPRPFTGTGTVSGGLLGGDLAMPVLGYDHPYALAPAPAKLTRRADFDCGPASDSSAASYAGGAAAGRDLLRGLRGHLPTGIDPAVRLRQWEERGR